MEGTASVMWPVHHMLISLMINNVNTNTRIQKREMQICMERKICKKDFLFCLRSFQEKCTVATKGEPTADDQTFEKFYNTLLLDLIILI